MLNVSNWSYFVVTKQNQLLNIENKKLLNEIKQMKADANRLAMNSSKNRSVSRNKEYTTTSGMTSCRDTAFGKKRYSFNQVKSYDSQVSKPKQTKSKVNGIV